MPRPRRAAASESARSELAPQVHGASRRGAARRQQLVDAATAILESAGFEAVSHRAVAAQAGLPLAATTYYFATLDDLRAAALNQLGLVYLAGARRLVEGLPSAQREPADVGRLLVQLVAGAPREADPARLLTFYERYIQAGRHPALRGMVRGWTAELGRLAGAVLERSGHGAPLNDGDLPQLLIATIDGLLLDALIDGDPQAPSRAAEGVARLLTLLLGASATGEVVADTASA